MSIQSNDEIQTVKNKWNIQKVNKGISAGSLEGFVKDIMNIEKPNYEEMSNEEILADKQKDAQEILGLIRQASLEGKGGNKMPSDGEKKDINKLLDKAVKQVNKSLSEAYVPPKTTSRFQKNMSKNKDKLMVKRDAAIEMLDSHLQMSLEKQNKQYKAALAKNPGDKKLAKLNKAYLKERDSILHEHSEVLRKADKRCVEGQKVRRGIYSNLSKSSFGYDDIAYNFNPKHSGFWGGVRKGIRGVWKSMTRNPIKSTIAFVGMAASTASTFGANLIVLPVISFMAPVGHFLANLPGVQWAVKGVNKIVQLGADYAKKVGNGFKKAWNWTKKAAGKVKSFFNSPAPQIVGSVFSAALPVSALGAMVYLEVSNGEDRNDKPKNEKIEKSERKVGKKEKRQIRQAKEFDLLFGGGPGKVAKVSPPTIEALVACPGEIQPAKPDKSKNRSSEEQKASSPMTITPKRVEVGAPVAVASTAKTSKSSTLPNTNAMPSGGASISVSSSSASSQVRQMSRKSGEKSGASLESHKSISNYRTTLNSSDCIARNKISEIKEGKNGSIDFKIDKTHCNIAKKNNKTDFNFKDEPGPEAIKAMFRIILETHKAEANPKLNITLNVRTGEEGKYQNLLEAVKNEKEYAKKFDGVKIANPSSPPPSMTVERKVERSVERSVERPAGKKP